MEPTPKRILKSIGYEVDSRGNVRQSATQLALVSIEDAGDGGVLRIHGDAERFFCEAEEMPGNLAFPLRVTQNYIYFQGAGGCFRVPSQEFVENMAVAFCEYNRAIARRMGG